VAGVGFLIYCRGCRFRKWLTEIGGELPPCPRCEATDWRSAVIDEPRRPLELSRDDLKFLKSFRIRAD
jgi:hypothetical protein